MTILQAAEAAGSSSGTSGYWQLALVLAAIGLLGIFTRWRKAKYNPPPPARELRERDLEPNRYRDAADRALVDLLETSREISAQIDNKIRVLNRLVKDAEEQTARLERLLGLAGERHPPEERQPAEPASPPAKRAEPVPGTAFISELHERIARLREEGKSVAEIAKATNLSTTEVRFAMESMGTAAPPDRGADQGAS